MNINHSKGKLFINLDDNEIRYYDTVKEMWKGITKDDGEKLICLAAKNENIEEAVKIVIANGKTALDISQANETCFHVENVRTGEKTIKTSDELKNLIINTTKGKYVEQQVRKEMSGKRPSILKEEIKKLNYEIYQDIFLIVSNRAINPDKKTRYFVIIENDCDGIENIINENIPIYKIKKKEKDENISFLSGWFRKTIGYGFCVTDVDFLLKNNYNILTIEEKVGVKNNNSVGQNISRKEFLHDVLKPNYNKEFLYAEFTDNKVNVKSLDSTEEQTLSNVHSVISKIKETLGEL